MIITIKGADFSGSNIGTLDTYLVGKSIGAGATYDIPNYVTKNAAVSWTITLAEGYTFGTYSVTMGGETITPTVSENGKTMAIVIPSVIGKVMISVATVNENTGEESTLSVVDITNEFEFTDSAMINANTGALTNYNGWKASDYVDISQYAKIEIKMSKTSSTTTGTGLALYDVNKQYISGIPHTDGVATYGVMVKEIEITENIAYVRTTYWSESNSNYKSEYGEFYCKAYK